MRSLNTAGKVTFLPDDFLFRELWLSADEHMPWQGEEKASMGNACAHYLCFRYILYVKKKKLIFLFLEVCFQVSV